MFMMRPHARRSSVFVGILNQLSAPSAAAYSLRKLSSAYSGPAINVRRSSDNAAQDIGFTSSGDLDTAALLAFVGSGDGFITTQYDQSGNGYSGSQATASNQPKIVSAGSLSYIGSRPRVQITTGLHLQTTISSLAQPISTSAVSIQKGTKSSYSWWFGSKSFLIGQGNGFEYEMYAGSSVNIGSWTNGNTVTTFLSNNTSSEIFQNGSSFASALSIGSNPLGTSVTVYASNYNTGNNGNSDFGEIIVFPSLLSTTDRQTLERNQGTYYGITVA